MLQAFYVWCNGHLVGFSKDSRLPAEFDLTGMHPCNVRVTSHQKCLAVVFHAHTLCFNVTVVGGCHDNRCV
jgi:beta-galactosidase/beta-glucuronidase